MIIALAPSDAAADAAETALAGGSVFGIQATLAARQGRYLIVLCPSTMGRNTLMAEVESRAGWSVLAWGKRVQAADLLTRPSDLLTWASGYLTGRGV